MNLDDAQKCIDLTSNFYRTVADSFSSTRKDAWVGWLEAIRSTDLGSEVSVLDLACGNMRFEEFLARQGFDVKRAVCIDNCPALAKKSETSVEYIECDILCDLPNHHKEADLVVCFGFMHHVPLSSKRLEIIQYLIDNTRFGGYIIISFWQFLRDERIAKKSELATREVCEQEKIKFDDSNDRFLRWKDDESVARYCHNFLNGEIESLLASVSEQIDVVNSFNADGKQANLNHYVVMKKK